MPGIPGPTSDRRRIAWRSLAACYAAVAAVAALPLFSRLGLPVAPAGLLYLAALAGAIVALRSASAHLFSRPRTAIAASALLVLLLGAADAAMYGRSRSGPEPSTAPDAMIEPAGKLLAGEFPYSVDLRAHAPASPGIGWVALNAPLTLAGLAPLLSAIWLAAAAAALARRAPPAAAVFVALNLANLHFLRLSFVGHDLFAFSCALVVLIELLAAEDRASPRRVALLAVAAGLVATARVPFALAPAILAFLVFRRDRRAGTWFGVVSLGTAALLHGAMILWARAAGSWYQPLHVFGRAGRSGSILLVAGAAVWLGVSLVVLLRARDDRFAWHAVAWLVLATPFATVGLAELAASPSRIAGWEGANYVAFALPVLAAALASGMEAGGVPGTPDRSRS